MPTLSRTPTSRVDVPAARAARRRAARCAREERRLDGEGEEEAEEQQPLDRDRHRGLREVPHEVRREERVLGPRARGRVDRHLHVERDDGREHDEAAREREQQELHGGVAPPCPDAEPADHEVDRDQHGLEQHVEEEHVARDEHRDHERLEQQHEREVVAQAADVAVLLLPRGEHDERDQQHRERDERERDAVGAHRVARPDLRDPAVRLGELVGARRRRVERGERADEQAELDERRTERDAAHGTQRAGTDAARAGGGREPHRRGTHQGPGDEQGQPGDGGGHGCLPLSSRSRWSGRGRRRRRPRGRRASSRRTSARSRSASRGATPHLADESRQAHPAAVDHLLVGVDERAREVLAGAHEHGLVDVVLVQVAPGRAREHRAARGADRRSTSRTGATRAPRQRGPAGASGR